MQLQITDKQKRPKYPIF